MSYSLPKELNTLLRNYTPNFNAPISITCSFQYILTPCIRCRLFQTIDEVINVEDNELEDDYSPVILERKFYTKNYFTPSLGNTQEKLMVDFIILLINIINGDLSFFDEFWIIKRSLSYIRSPLILSVTVSFNNSFEKLSSTSVCNIINLFSDLDKLLLLENKDVS